jgi:formylglycine-generating enzyme required for sulfatase activity
MVYPHFLAENFKEFAMIRNPAVRYQINYASSFLCAVLFAIFPPLVTSRGEAAPMEWVTVANPNNAPDSSGFGSVSEVFRIGKFEVTNAQYVDFLNNVASTDPLELYDTKMADFGIQRASTSNGFTYSLTADTAVNWGVKPVNAVSWYDAIRFANWMNNGMGSGDTETGAYTLQGGTPTPSNPGAIVRNTDARVWLPSIDEWYKAAYYDAAKPEGAGYWTYPTASDIAPSNQLLNPDPGNSANFTGGNLASTLPGDLKLTDVGQFTNSASAYGTFDQAGNLAEWSESLVPGIGMLRASLGGSWGSLMVGLQGSNAKFAFNGPAVNSDRGGFRLASSIPEPTSAILTLVGAALLLTMGRNATCSTNS